MEHKEAMAEKAVAYFKQIEMIDEAKHHAYTAGKFHAGMVPRVFEGLETLEEQFVMGVNDAADEAAEQAALRDATSDWYC